MKALRKLLAGIFKEEAGQALPLVLILLTLGSFMVIPTIDFSGQSAKLVRTYETNFKAYWAAEAGIEDAFWKLKADQISVLPYSYQLSSINGMTVDITVEDVTEIAGVPIGYEGVHGGWLRITKHISYNNGIYTFSIEFENNGAGNMKIQKILIDFPKNLDYVQYSTSGNISHEEPEVVGTADMGETLYWDVPPPHYTINPSDSGFQNFQMSGPPGIVASDTHAVTEATREDVGTVWDSDSRPYKVTVTATDAGASHTTIKAGLWKGTHIQVSCWQVNPR